MKFLERGVRRLLRMLDAMATRAYGWAWNPLHQSGTVAIAMLLTLIATGAYLILFYRPGSPAESVARLAADPWLGGWMRSLHRYASDLFVLAAVLHLLRMFAQARSWGPRTLAWVSGLILLGTGLVCAWTGFVMAWDTFGERLALEGGRLLDVLPIFSEPLSRIFAGDGAVPGAFFFVNMFMHIGLPLAMGAVLWLHVSRVARPVLLPPRRLMWTTIAALTATAVLVPARLGPAADPFHLAEQTPTDLLVAWWLPVAERLPAGTVWGLGLAGTLVLLLVPRWTRRPRQGSFAPSVVDPRRCTGCNQCPQDCPWDAITMVKRDDDRPTLLAQVDPERCVSCGICAGSCAPMGIGPPGRNGRDQLARARSEASPNFGVDGRKSVVAVCCSQVPVSHVEALRTRGAFIHTVSCIGNLHSSVIELFVRGGAPGVVICACPPRDCVNREGPKWLGERLFNEREAELQARVDRRRVRVITAAPGNRHAVVAAYELIAREMMQLAQPATAPLVVEEVECEPVPMEVESG